ncbi:MAG: DUF2071 domain-containing protein [Planctomycetota bacterium]
MTDSPGHAATRPWLEAALIFTLVIHGVGMLSMVLFLLPGIPGGTETEVAARAAHLAEHPWRWRIGWLPWQLTAVSDLLLGVALVGTAWIRKAPAIMGAMATLAAIVPDQLAQYWWTWEGVSLARHAVEVGDFGAFQEFESRIFVLTAGWGAAGYTLGAVCWTWCFAGAGIWSRRLLLLSVAAWGMFAASTAIVFVPDSVRQLPAVGAAVSVGNGVAFVLLMLWLAGVSERVLRRNRPDRGHGSFAPWRHPSRGLVARTSNLVANSRLARALGRLIPPLAMSSDIVDVVYVNYLVDAGSLERFVDPGLELQRLGPGGRLAMFSVLTFRHGHFGPSCFGPLRRLWPSPVQSNWRIYVRNPRTGRAGVQFVTTAITSTPHALATRLLSDGVAMHVPARAQVRRDADGSIHAQVDPGAGSSPDLSASLLPTTELTLQHEWRQCFASWREMLEYCVPQDRAMCARVGSGWVVRQEIALHIPLESCRPLSGSVVSHAAEAFVGTATPLCFGVDRVGFRFVAQKLDR